MKPLKIAFAMINCNRRDGSARAVNEVAERLAQRGHDVHLYARKAEDLDLAKIRWHRVPGPGWPEVADFLSFHWLANRMIGRQRFDIVHSVGCNTLQANVVTIQNIQPAKKKVLDALGSTERVSLPRRMTRRLYLATTSRAERKLYTHRSGRKPPLFLPVSLGVERELRAHYKIGPAPVRIVPNAADVAVFRPLPDAERQTWRAANGFTPSDTILVFSGGEWARKGLDCAIQALALLPETPETRIRMFVAGDDPDRLRFQQLAADLGLGARVVFGGFRRDMALAFASADLFLFPSRYEAFSLATIEAAACGLPVVATRINGAEDFVQPGITGEFISHDPAEIARVLAPLVASPALRREMGRRARLLVEERYTWDRVADLTESAYREYLSGDNNPCVSS